MKGDLVVMKEGGSPPVKLEGKRVLRSGCQGPQGSSS